MSTVVEQLYLGLLSDPTVAPDLQRRIFVFAKQRKAYGLLTSLTSHPALLPELDALLGEFNNVKVRAAWALRQNRTAEELIDLACKDPRAAVIVDLAARQDLPDDAYQQMARRGHQKVDWVLVSNPRVPLELRLSVARRLGSGISREGYSTSAKIAAALGDQPELHDAFAAEATSPIVFELVASTAGLSETTQLRLIDAAVEAGKAAAKAATSAGTWGMYWLSGEYSLYTFEKVLRGLASNPDLAPSVLDKAKELKGVLSSNASFDSTVELLLSRGASMKANPSGLNPLTEARTTTEPQVLARHVTAALKNRDPALASAPIANPASGADIVSKVAGVIHHDSVTRLVRIRRVDVPALVALLAGRYYYLSDELLSATSAPEQVLQGIALAIAAEGRALPGNLLSSRYITPKMVEHLPAASLSMGDVPPSLSQTVSRVLESTFGRSTQHREIFETLGDNFSGTLRDLLDGVLAIAGEVSPEELSPGEVSSETVSEVPVVDLSQVSDVALEDVRVDVSETSAESAGDVCEPEADKHSSAKKVRSSMVGEQVLFTM